MKMGKVHPGILKAATVLLQDSCPDLSPTSLVDAIKQYDGATAGRCLTVEEAAQWLRVDKRTVQNYIRDGKLKVIRIGQTVRIPESFLFPVDDVQNASDVVDGQ